MNIFSKVFWSKRRKIVAGALAGLSGIAVAVAVPVALSRSGNTSALRGSSAADGPKQLNATGVATGKSLLIVAAGQSNMQGVIPSDPYNKNSYKFSDKTPVVYTSYVNGTPNGQGGVITAAPAQLRSAGDGPGGFNIVKGIAFKQADTLNYDKIWVVNSAIGGTGFRNSEAATGFPASQTPFGRAYQVGMVRQGIDLNPDLKAALSQGSVEVVMTWLQGENDANYVANEAEADQYADMIAGYLTAIRELLPVTAGTTVPIVVGAMEPSWGVGVGSGAPIAQRMLVQQAITTIPGKLEYSAYVNSTGLPVNSREKDWIHYGLTQLGPMADRYISKIAVARNNSATNRLPIRSLDNRVFGQFTTTQTSFWPDAFNAGNFHTALAFNKTLTNLANGTPTNANFSNLGKLYAYKSGDADPQKQYRIRMRLYSTMSWSPFIEIYFVQSVNPVFFSDYVSKTANAYFAIEQLKIYGSGAPAFTKDNVDLGIMRAIGSDPTAWSAGPFAAAFTMNSGNTELSFPMGAKRTGPLGRLASKDKTMSWNYDHITIDAIIPGIS